MDVTDDASCVRAVKAEHNVAGALVNNAGYALGGVAEELSVGDLRSQFETNVFGPVRLPPPCAGSSLRLWDRIMLRMVPFE
nr:hypothetical protein GCM10010200_026990 [Actinomadura rugatobispora]